MKQIICDTCSKIWYVPDQDLSLQQVCPYCMSYIKGQLVFNEYDSLDKAIYGAVLHLGIDVIENPRKLVGFLSDTSPNLQKEIRIFSKSYSERYISYLKTAFEQEPEESALTIQKLHDIFIEEEGLSDNWADMLCKSIYGAVLYYQGIGITQLVNVQVNDFVINPVSPPPYPTNPPKIMMKHYEGTTTQKNAPPTSLKPSESDNENAEKTLPDIGEVITFGKINGEPMKWIVLNIDLEKRLMLILAQRELKKKRKYNETLKAVTWERCTLRRFLNDEFYSNFSDSEKSIIAQTFLENTDNIESGTEGGSNTVDKIFLLSVDEALTYFDKDISRNLRSDWWLRSPGSMQDRAALVISYGEIFTEGHYVSVAYGVRPAMNLKI